MQDLLILAAVVLAALVVIGLMVSIRSSAAGELPRVTWRRILIIAAAAAGTFLSMVLSRIRNPGDVIDVDTISQKFVVSPLSSSNIVWIAVSVIVTLILWGLAISQISSIPPVTEGCTAESELPEIGAGTEEACGKIPNNDR